MTRGTQGDRGAGEEGFYIKSALQGLPGVNLPCVLVVSAGFAGEINS